MIKINNPFINKSFNCFACSPNNNRGLHMEFWLDNSVLVAKYSPTVSYEGYTNILHGGIQATLMDEAAAWFIFVVLGTAGVTTKINILYSNPVYISKGQIYIRAQLISIYKRKANIECILYDGEGEKCASAQIFYYCFPKDIAIKKYNYPGKETFFQK